MLSILLVLGSLTALAIPAIAVLAMLKWFFERADE